MREPSQPPNLLSDAEIEQFWSDGVIIVRNLYSPEWVDKLRHGLNEVCGIDEAATTTPAEPLFRSDAYTWHTNDHLRDFSLFGPSAHLVKQVLRTDRLNFFCDQIFVKQAYNSERTPWHHDFTFFPLTGNQIASVWTSVDPVSANRSGLEFVVGSHRWPQRFRPLGVGGIVKSVAQMDATPDPEDLRSKYKIASWDMQPGDAVLFHALTLHGSRGTSGKTVNRRALATRWCGDDARYTPTGKELQVAWPHGLNPGDSIGGPVFPQVLPEMVDQEIAARLRGPIPPDPAIVAQNQSLAKRFEKVPL
ncbi:phytanoyl-CoA dioxygenase family protein [Puniceibacterium sp. IMCC21224]|uniref:phytanoyl-CoA dioxygenase family protein n=1 Tax=Puniceibacterium sp. IMCC21224 TaxID=1618204 RepID=UPI00065D38B1|nr:phytanoyl-CoA dioxygenase family protein [Puniceibacterium sp. IMCC21224]KMK69076.1 protein involved in biosynthesis of mitomycin antibiotics/polyketide fumonisin [Puniceibacterium sp. IMCC21224]